MYIKRLEKWSDFEWNYFFWNNKIKEKDQEKVKIILKREKNQIELHFDFLKKVGLINGIGPGFFGKIFRNILTKLFPYVRYEWHDIEYSLGGNEVDRLKADYGLLKYSIKGQENNKFNKFIIKFCYKMVLFFGSFNYNYNN